MTLRVVQWTTGNVGMRSVRAVVANPELELVGCYAWGDDKVGRDVGVLCGIDPIGVVASNDVDALLALRPDCVVYNPKWPDVDHLVRILEAGVNVVLTRSTDVRVVLGTRSQLVDKLHPKAFVSVHHNSSPDGPHAGPGTETFYQVRSASSKRLAGLVYEEVTRALSAYQLDWVGNVDAGAKYRLNDRGGDYYHMLRETAGVPSALAELAFISDPPEAALLARPDVQQIEGQAVARGILRDLRTSDPGTGYVTPVPRTTPAGGGGGEGCVDPPL